VPGCATDEFSDLVGNGTRSALILRRPCQVGYWDHMRTASLQEAKKLSEGLATVWSRKLSMKQSEIDESRQRFARLREASALSGV